MSYTFLPYSEQQHIRREYRILVLIVLFFLLSISFMIGVGSLFPAYIFAVLEEHSHLDQVAAFQKTVDASSITTTQKELSQSASTLDTISKTLESDLFYSTIRAVVALKGNVTLTSFAVEHPTTKVMSIIISGIAPTRADLLSFKSRLQGISNKATVDLPLSTLAQDIHVTFSIQVTEVLP